MRCKFCEKEFKQKGKENFCSKVCAARFNTEKSKKVSASIKQQNIKKYNLNPKVCKNCGKELSHRESKYCSIKCQKDFSFKERGKEVNILKEFPLGKSTLSKIKEVNRNFVRKYLEYKYGHKCSICGNTHWLGKPILLIVDHIDGDIENYNVNNYRLICSNCDATLPTYKGRNKGKGKRIYRRLK